MKLTTVKAAKAADTGKVLEHVVTSGRNADKLRSKAKKAETSAWPFSAALFINGAIPVDGDYESPADVMDLVRDVFVDNLDVEILNGIETDKNDDIKFRSDPATVDMWKFASVISRAIVAGITYSDMFEDEENDGKIPSKGFIEKLTRDKKSNLEKLKQVLETATKIAANMHEDSKADIAEAQKAVGELLGTIGMAPEESE